MLTIERKRTERSHKPFLLMLVNVSEFTIHSNNASMLESLIDALHGATREIDIKGWYDHGKTIGIIFTEVTPDNSFLITSKVNSNLSKNLSVEQLKLVNISNFS